jgi:glycosyltransferase involved in cell wall biosynthesis
MIVLEAFESILEAVPGVELVFIGRIGWITSADRERLENFRESHPSFRLVTDADDETIRNCVSNARATIFVSAAEGFGLPPVESLWLGTPVIASKHLPSLEELGDEGVCIVDPLSSATVRDTAMALLDEAFYRTKVVQASRLDLPRWECFAHGIAEWTGAVHQSPIARP